MYESKISRFQKCSYSTKKGEEFKQGIAKLNSNVSFGTQAIEFILNENGNKVEKVHDYFLHELEFSCMHIAIELEN